MTLPQLRKCLYVCGGLEGPKSLSKVMDVSGIGKFEL